MLVCGLVRLRESFMSASYTGSRPLGARRRPPPRTRRPPVSRCRPILEPAPGVEAPTMTPGRSHGAGFAQAQTRRRGSSRVRRRCRFRRRASSHAMAVEGAPKDLTIQLVTPNATTNNCRPLAKNISGTSFYENFLWVHVMRARSGNAAPRARQKHPEKPCQDNWLEPTPQPKIADPLQGTFTERARPSRPLFRELFIGTRHAGSPAAGRGHPQARTGWRRSGSGCGGAARGMQPRVRDETSGKSCQDNRLSLPIQPIIADPSQGTFAEHELRRPMSARGRALAQAQATLDDGAVGLVICKTGGRCGLSCAAATGLGSAQGNAAQTAGFGNANAGPDR
jgi:hypothetical protein